MKGFNIDIKWLIIIALGAYIFLLQQCSGGKEPCDTIVTTKTVTALIPGIPDTTYIEIEKPIYIKVNIPVPTTITVPAADGDMIVNEYTTEIKDSLLEGSITSRVDGTLVSQEFNYVPLFPKYIHVTDTFKEAASSVVVKKHAYLGIGGEIGGSSTSINISPKITYTTKNNYIYSYRYGALDETHNIGVIKNFNAKEIFNRKKLARVIN